MSYKPNNLNKANMAFHSATQFGKHLADVVVKDVKKVARVVSTRPIAKIKEANRLKNISMREMDRKARSGEYN